MMSKHILYFCALVLGVSLLLSSSTAFGWGGPSHSAMCHQVFDDAVVAPLLSQISNVSTIEDWTGEPASGWQDGQWDNVEARAYIPGIDSPNGKDWDSLDETTRLKYMMHNVGDVAVPIGHSPACRNPNGYSNTIIEGILELQVSTWGTYPDIEGTTTWYNDESGHTYHYTGTIYDVLDEHYYACRDNRDWYKSTEHWPGYHTTGENQDAGWNGTAIAQMLMRAMIVDYILGKQPEDAVIDGNRILGPGDDTTFDASGSIDPDNIIWNSDGTYTHTYGTLYQYRWDLDNDGTWDVIDDDPYDKWTYEELVAFGIPTGQWCTFKLGVYEEPEEGGSDYAYAQMYLQPSGAPEPASLSLLAIGGLGVLLRRKR
ncbi:MAG: PEP-CTERM sorting domain-containing protein [Phycisphaerae bacterium]|nr:PEP-CTERM sorting domain-containing protein [Phycisphaerae bacterium]